MQDKRIGRWLPGLIVTLALLPAATTVSAQIYDDRVDAIVIRRTIPDPHAVERQPLTSDRLSTTSTRYIDARRGFRPFSSVDAGHNRGYARPYARPVIIGFDDNFGISRADDRPYGVSQRTPRTSVSRFENRARPTVSRITPDINPRLIVVVNDRREPPHQARPQHEQAIVIHSDKPRLPDNSGAVIISSDGTVIQVGD